MFAGVTVYWVAGKDTSSGTLRFVARVVAGYPSMCGCEGTSMSSGPGLGIGKLKLLCNVIRDMPPTSPDALHRCLFS